MSILEKLENFKLKNLTQDPEVNYLTDPDFCIKLNSALSELYRIQPANPVTFLANYLINEHKSNDILEIIKKNNNIRTESIIKYDEKTKEYKITQQKEKEKIENFENKKTQLIGKIKSSDNIENIYNDICESLKEISKSTGCYLCYYDKKRKSVGEYEDENAHLLDYEVIRYIAYDKNHEELLKHKCLEPGEGVTYELFNANEENPEDPNNVNNEETNNNTTTEVKPPLKNVYIPEVIRNNNVKFFKEPKLGAYLALDVSYQSSCSLKSLESSIAMWNEYLQEQVEIEQKKVLKEQEKKELDNNNNDTDNNQNDNVNDEENKENTEEEEVAILKPYETELKKVVLCLDTLGQDRDYNEKEMEFIYLVGKVLVDSLFELEKRLLLKDRDLKIESKEKEAKYLEDNKDDKIKEREDLFYKDYLFQKYEDNPPMNDEQKQIDFSFSKCQFIIHNILEEDNFIHDDILLFSRYELVPFERIFQNLFYFVGISNKEINIPDTNKLDWKKARKYWTLDKFQILKEYNPFGPKPQKVPYFALVNRQLEIFEQLHNNLEEIKETNYALSRLVEFMFTLLTLRRDNVFKRKKEFYEYSENRKLAIEKKEHREQQMKEELEIARQEWEDEQQRLKEEMQDNMDNNPEQTQNNESDVNKTSNNEEKEEKEDNEEIEVKDNVFNEEKWIANWLLDKSVIEIKDEITPDEDNDIELNIEDYMEKDSDNMAV